jgi:hypothetical protein
VKHLILAALHALTPSALDTESPAERCARLAPIAQAIAEVCSDAHCAAALIALGQVESRFAERVQAGRCRRHECDSGRSRGVWQLNIRAVNRETWRVLGRYGDDSLRIGAREALRIWRYGLKRCGGKLSCARARYRGTIVVSGADRAFARRVLRVRQALSL